jgi:hypothetical protein
MALGLQDRSNILTKDKAIHALLPRLIGRNRHEAFDRWGGHGIGHAAEAGAAGGG